ncbi:ATP-binding protein [Sorangium sp. So ce861]|uniref:ATP-binding protein n=1 Tax=Sorangium sp. So ce861 TaxID=3133323 RepID=UPI003F601145
MPSQTIDVAVNAGKEIFEIGKDFANPVEVLREALHNSYDAGATEVTIRAYPQKLVDGRRVLSLEISDNGQGMDERLLKSFFSLGFSEKEPVPGRPSIGFKGHGTKIYYQAQDVLVLTRRKGGQFLLAHLPDARTRVYKQEVPQPTLLTGQEAQSRAREEGLPATFEHGTVIRLIDFTPDSLRVVDSFRHVNIENYLRWFTIFGSFEHVVDGSIPKPPMRLFLQGTGESKPREIEFGHPWPQEDLTDIKTLRTKDPRRPFNFFRKTFRARGYATEGSYLIDIAAIFEGARGREVRDPGIRVRGRQGALYREEDRYGLWLCKDFIPVEKRFEWLSDEDCPTIMDIDPGRALVLVNCQDFSLTANRGSVGNSPAELLEAIKRATYRFLEEKISEDTDLKSFADEYREEIFSRLREKDKKALQRRVERYNKKHWCTIKLPNGREHGFFEPQREITLFGLVSELHSLAPEVLDLHILDYDDHKGIDLLVRRNGDPSDLLDRTKVAYTELKYELTRTLNHPFDNLYAILCWDSMLSENDIVTDPTERSFTYKEIKDEDGVTHSRLVPPPDSPLSHNVRVIVLSRYLQEKFELQLKSNPKQITASSGSSSAARGRRGRR